MKVSSRLVRGPIDELVDRSVGSYLPSYDETRTVLGDYQQMAVRRAGHKWAFSDLQHHLLMSMRVEQSHVKVLQRATPATAQRELHETYVELAKLPFLGLRRIADGMAFRFLNYDMALLQSLAGNAVGIEDLYSDGMLHELEFAAATADHDHASSQVLMCALSDVLNIGDVVVKTDDSFEVFELKKGKASRGARISRQKDRLTALTEFFTTRARQVAGNPVQLLQLPARRHRLAELERALRTCEGSSPTLLEVSSFQTVWCCDVRNAAESDLKELVGAADADATARFGHSWTKITSYEYRHRVGVTVPMTVFPFTADMIADILLGGLVYVSYVSIAALAAHIEKRGWIAIDVAKPSVEKRLFGSPVLHVFDARDRDKNYSFPVDLLLDAALSLIDIDSVLVGLEQTAGTPGNWTPFYEDESSLWR